MAKLIIRRLLLGLVTMWVVSLMVFGTTEVLPGDVATAVLGQSATPEALKAIREELGLTGTKLGCDRGECGACTTLVDGEPINSCSTLTHTVRERAVQTIEGLAAPQRVQQMPSVLQLVSLSLLGSPSVLVFLQF